MKKTIEAELESIRKRNRHILRARAVVDFARDPKTALHAKFQWDDGKAADEYRLWQAREIISVAVRVIGSDPTPIRTYVSLTDDRARKGGGYRAIVDVLSDQTLRKRMIAQALAEYTALGEKYERLKELQPIRKAVQQVTKQASAKPTRAKEKRHAA